MQESKNKTTVQWLQQTGALCLLQPIQRAVTRLETEQSSHVLTTNVKYSGELIKWGAYKMLTKEVSTVFTK